MKVVMSSDDGSLLPTAPSGVACAVLGLGTSHRYPQRCLSGVGEGRDQSSVRVRCGLGKRARQERLRRDGKNFAFQECGGTGYSDTSYAPTPEEACGHSSAVSGSESGEDSVVPSDEEEPPLRQPFRYARDRTLDDMNVAAGAQLNFDELGPAWSRAPPSVLEAAKVLAELEASPEAPTPLHRQKLDTVHRSPGQRAAPQDDGERDQTYLLPPPIAAHADRHTLVLDLDETLVHSTHALTGGSCDPLDQHCDWNESLGDFYCEVEDEGDVMPVYVRVRPKALAFLRDMSELFEVVLFTAGTSKYASAVVDRLDPERRLLHHVLTREHCTFCRLSDDGDVVEMPRHPTESGAFHNVNFATHTEYIKDLSRLGRPIDRTIIVDNNPRCYMLHPRNAMGCTTWRHDRHDNELEQFGLFLDAVSLAPEVFSDLDEFHKQLASMASS